MSTTTETRYIEAIGRRKTAIARVRITPGTKASFEINEKKLEDFFKTKELQAVAMDAITKSKLGDKFKITVKVNGGGINGQAESVRLGIARALLTYDAELRAPLKKLGFLKRDPRAKERRKFGLKKARKSPQWSKR